MNKKIVHDALILTVFTVVIGFILGLVYEITKDPIAKAEEATAQAASKQCLKMQILFPPMILMQKPQPAC